MESRVSEEELAELLPDEIYPPLEPWFAHYLRREVHVADPLPYVNSNDPPQHICRKCRDPWPCPPIRMLHERERMLDWYQARIREVHELFAKELADAREQIAALKKGNA
jgi:hypothetical protein